MGSKANILALLVLCMAWQAHAYVNCNRTGPGKFPDPADTTCQGFTLCIHKHATDSLIGLKFVCPNQKIFNPHYGYCVFDSKYNCNGSNSTSPGNTDSTSTCTEEGVFADPYSTNCKTYITCLKINGTLTESIHKCPYDAIFDPSFGFCVYGTNYTCSGSNSTSSGNNNTDSTSTCTEEGVFADPYSTNCKTYITCFKINGTLTESILKCPYDAIFDPSFGFCVYVTNYTCSGSNSTSSGNNNTDSTSTCTEEGVFADPYSNNCKTYITCFKINGTLTESIHKCPYDAIFDPSFGFCVYGTNYTCNGSNGTYPGPGNNNTNSSSICTEEGFVANPDSYNCSTYVGCVKINSTFVKYVYSCPSSTFFNPNTTFCESSYSCKTVEPFACTSTGRFADVSDVTCQSFFFCTEVVNGVFIQHNYTCPPPSVFSPISGLCTTSHTCNRSV